MGRVTRRSWGPASAARRRQPRAIHHRTLLGLRRAARRRLRGIRGEARPLAGVEVHERRVRRLRYGFIWPGAGGSRRAPARFGIPRRGLGCAGSGWETAAGLTLGIARKAARSNRDGRGRYQIVGRARERQISRSAVTKLIPSTIAVAPMRRSAGSFG